MSQFIRSLKGGGSMKNYAVAIFSLLLILTAGCDGHEGPTLDPNPGFVNIDNHPYLLCRTDHDCFKYHGPGWECLQWVGDPRVLYCDYTGSDLSSGSGGPVKPPPPKQPPCPDPNVIDCPEPCGNDHCNQAQGESCQTCPADCGPCGWCGDGICQPGESCPQDCHTQCQVGAPIFIQVCYDPADIAQLKQEYDVTIFGAIAWSEGQQQDIWSGIKGWNRLIDANGCFSFLAKKVCEGFNVDLTIGPYQGDFWANPLAQPKSWSVSSSVLGTHSGATFTSYVNNIGFKTPQRFSNMDCCQEALGQ
jgi:hypothetical protein